MAVADAVRELVAPLLDPFGVELYDVEHGGGVLRVVVDRPGGVDLGTLTDLTRLLSRTLDVDDPVPGRYTLEVTSPGLERNLRLPSHYQGARGDHVSIKLDASAEGERRLRGVLVSADDEGIVVEVAPQDRRELRYEQIQRARTVFEWGPTPKPGGSARKKERRATAR